jgi:hypothetical protein
MADWPFYMAYNLFRMAASCKVSPSGSFDGTASSAQARTARREPARSRRWAGASRSAAAAPEIRKCDARVAHATRTARRDARIQHRRISWRSRWTSATPADPELQAKVLKFM